MGALLRFGHQMVLDRLLAALAAAGFDDLNEAHFKVLRYPPPDGTRPSVLAQRAKMSKQAMNYLLVQLEKLGYVRRHGGVETSGRLVSLTDRGWEVAALQRRTVRAIEREWARKVGEGRFATFMEVLHELVATPRLTYGFAEATKRPAVTWRRATIPRRTRGNTRLRTAR
ncbi:MAG TPA: hypothetical protein VHC69_28985 [Polyangiaceae bacterium]|nr:hypothetical protein [Polyangiaceae bacterium]